MTPCRSRGNQSERPCVEAEALVEAARQFTVCNGAGSDAVRRFHDEEGRLLVAAIEVAAE